LGDDGGRDLQVTDQAYIKSIEAENELLRNKIDAYERAFDIVGKHAFIDMDLREYNTFVSNAKEAYARLNISFETCWLSKEEFDAISQFVSVKEKKTNRNWSKNPS
jgi:hypothetical protein